MLSRVVEWLQNVSKACVKSFLNKHVDIIITDREETTRKGSLKIASQKRSALMLGMATKAKRPTFSGTSSIFKIASTWNMKILKYIDVISCMNKRHCVPTRQCTQVAEYKKGHIYTLRSPFLKIEDHSRKYRPEFVEMKSFPYLDLDTEGTTSPFDTWFRENYALTK